MLKKIFQYVNIYYEPINNYCYELVNDFLYTALFVVNDSNLILIVNR